MRGDIFVNMDHVISVEGTKTGDEIDEDGLVVPNVDAIELHMVSGHVIELRGEDMAKLVGHLERRIARNKERG